MKGRELDGGNDDKEPKWRASHVVWGHRHVFFFFLNFIGFLYTNIILMYIQFIIYIIYDRKRVGQQWQWQRAQTTHISCRQWCHLGHSSWPPPNEAGDGGNNQQRREITTGLASEMQHVSSPRYFFFVIFWFIMTNSRQITRNCMHGHQHYPTMTRRHGK